MDTTTTDDTMLAGLLFPRAFAARVQLPTDPVCECWTWLGRHDNGRPRYYDAATGRHIYAYRYARAVLDGQPMLDEDVGRHVCNNPACPNPHHIRPGTQAQNVRDMMLAGRVGGFVAEWKTRREDRRLDERLAYLLASED